ncbi:MAG: hypothetical protein ABH871_07650 [Pseudomonadota bacterium]
MGFYIQLFILGLISIVSQVIILRELTINFYGNEFFIGITLAAWLAWVAIGSVFPRHAVLRRSLILIQVLAVIFLFVEIFFIRYLKGVISLHGEIPNLVFAFFVAILSPAPLCFVLGLWWATGSELLAKASERASLAVNRGYFVETLGFILGGVLFSFLLVRFSSFTIAWLLALIVIVFLAFMIRTRLWLRGIFILVVVVSAWLIYSPLQFLEHKSTEFRFQHQRILKTENSPYGQLTVTQIGEQKNFYESGLLLGSDRDEYAAEELVHFPMLSHPRPKKVMLLGGGFNGGVSEVLKHDVDEVYYLELDPALIALARQYLPQRLIKDLNDPRVKIVNQDGYHFLKDTQHKFDVIIINLPDPSTALIDRFYTQEFFDMAAERLADEGIFSTHLSFAPDQPTETLTKLDAAVNNALKKAFDTSTAPNPPLSFDVAQDGELVEPQGRVEAPLSINPEHTPPFRAGSRRVDKIIYLPEESLFFIASRQDELTYNPDILLKRFKDRAIENKYVNLPYIKYRLSTDRIAQAQGLMKEQQGVGVNRAFKPIAYYFQTLFWLDLFYPKLERAFAFVAQWFWPITIFVVAILTIFLMRGDAGARKPIISVAVAGFSLMAMEIIIIFVYQTIVGFLYYRLALLISALMAGMALGVWLGNRWISRRSISAATLIKLHIFLILLSAMLFAIFSYLKASSLIGAEIILLICAILAGTFGALVFPLANHIYLTSQAMPSSRTGIIYSADVAGSAMGAILPSIILLPVFGVWQTLLFVGLMNLWVMGILKKPGL